MWRKHTPSAFSQFLHHLASSFSTASKPAPRQAIETLKNVQHVVAVASGKGGVGKSTAAANISVALATKLGLRVGLLDADVHGPSVPILMNLSGRPAVSQDNLLMIPLENYRVKCMSFGFFLQDDQPAIWRGPIVNSTIDKFLRGTSWGELDVLVVDMPPGTGDAQITLSQRLPLSGAVIISTPQDVALIDARRGARMFQAVRVPLLGWVENMSHYVCRNCGHKEHIFGEAGGKLTADDMEVRFLGQVPLDVAVRERSDAGAPIVVSDPQHPCALAYQEIASSIYQQLRALGGKERGGVDIQVD